MPENTMPAVAGSGHARDVDSGGGRLSLSGGHHTPGGAGCQTRVPVLGPDGKRVVAVIVGDVLTKHVDGSRHFLKNPPAIAFDAGAIAEAETLGVSSIAVTDRETGRVYRCSLSAFYAHSWRFDRGYGAQAAMRLSRWTTDGAPTAPAPAPQPVAVQLALGV